MLRKGIRTTSWQIVVLGAGSFLASELNAAEGFAQTGFTGNLRTPTASSLPYGEVRFAYRGEANVDKTASHAKGAHDTILLGIGLFPGLELTLQNTHKSLLGDEGYNSVSGSDLSFSAKLSSDYFYPQFPVKFALGVQDYGTHGATFHNNYYTAASTRWGRVAATAGFGTGDAKNQMGEDYLDGPFASASLALTDYFSLLADYDGTGNNVGLRLDLSQWISNSHWTAQATAQLYSDSKTEHRDNTYLGLSIGKRLLKGKIPTSYALNKERHVSNFDLPLTSAHNRSKSSTINQLNALSRLEHAGFESLQAGRYNDTPVISFENHTFGKNDAVAVGYALQAVSEHLAGDFYLLLKKYGLPVLAIRANSENIQRAYQQTRADLLHFTQASHHNIHTATSWLGKPSANSRFKPRVALAPSQRSSLGTEFGVIDYAIALSANLNIGLWPGAIVDIRGLTKSINSDDVGYIGHPVQPIQSGLNRALLHQAWPLNDTISTQVSAGLIRDYYYGILNESQWQSRDGQHKLALTAGKFEHELSSDVTIEPALASYRYYSPSFKQGFEIYGGQFWNATNSTYSSKVDGTGVKYMHWFGDVQVNLEIQKAEETYAGLYFRLPLDVNRRMAAKPYQITGTNDWNWGYATQLSGVGNYINASKPRSGIRRNTLGGTYFNRDRQSVSYLKANKAIIFSGMYQAAADH